MATLLPPAHGATLSSNRPNIVVLPIGPQIQGRSLIPLLGKTPAGWRQSVLVEFYTNEQPSPHLNRAVRSRSVTSH